MVREYIARRLADWKYEFRMPDGGGYDSIQYSTTVIYCLRLYVGMATILSDTALQ